MMKPNENRKTSPRLLDRLVMLRKQAGLSQSELGRRSGLTAAAISMIEAGDRDPKLSTAAAICDALNISLDALAGRSEYPHNEFTARIELTKAQQRLAQIRDLTT